MLQQLVKEAAAVANALPSIDPVVAEVVRRLRESKADRKMQAKEVVKHYREPNLFAFPSVNEGFGLVLLEAMASGLAVVATYTSGAAGRVTEGKERFVVASRNVDALAESIGRCYRHPDETTALGKVAGAEVVRQFALSKYVEKQVALYRTLDA